jgi:hypothetical protein
MALSPGDRLGPYEVVRLLGAGGMGEVYRAHDLRLRRDVALKVLHPSLAMDAEHVQRLDREARATGALNHPNILAVFDVGTEQGVPYIVSELLEGESLRERLARGPLPYRKTLEYGIQIALALGAAHEKGICHRDVKPGNVFITLDGRVKLLDFGLAKAHTSAAPAAPEDPTSSASRPGGIRGTPGYMSPEQLLGMPVDHRTDLFALGAVLYEMLMGARAFTGASTTAAMTAVLKDDPAEALELNPSLPPAAVAAIRRCLEKNREERFQSARDLAFHLKELEEGATGAGRSSTASGGRRIVLGLLAAAVVAEALALAVAWRPGRAPSFQQLTYRRGRIGGARFTSDGSAVIYSEVRVVPDESGQSNRREVWRLDLADSPQSHSLGHQGADLLAARQGELALSLQRRFGAGRRFVGTLALVPLGGPGRPRELAKDVEDADWDPAGAQLAIVRQAGSTGESVLEYPIGRALYRTPGSVRSPRVSRDGRRIAFLDDAAGLGIGGRVAVVDLEGHVTALTESWTSAHGLAWSSRGEVWFTAARGRTNRSLRAVDLEKTQRTVLDAAASLTLWDIAPDGRVLLTRDEERNALVGVPPGQTSERELSWFDLTGLADLSADGGTLLFGDRFGLYTRGTDGSPPVYLGLKDGFADALSPDGQTVLATSPSTSELVLLPTGPGEPRSVPAHGIASYKGALWFPDGRRILFNGVEPGRELACYVQDVSRDPPGPPGLLAPRRALSISRDGTWVAALEPGKGISLWPVAGGPSRLLPASEPDDRPVGFSADGRSLWVFRRGEVPARVMRLEIGSGRRDLWKVLWPPDPAGVYTIVNLKITPTGQSYFYTYASVLSQLYLVGGLK